MDIIKEYMLNTQFHGLRFIAESGRHWIERLFWLVCICVSWALCYVLIMASWRGFQDNSLSFGTETDYIQWNTSFFSVTVCEYKNKEKMNEKAEKYLGTGDTRNYNFGEALLDIAYFEGNHYFLKSLCSGPKADPKCPKDELKQFSLEVRSSCPEVISKCFWNSQAFDCCSYFQPLETERGLCFAINSLQTKKQSPFPLISNRNTGPGSLQLELNVPAAIYVLSPEDVPTFNTAASEWVLALKNLFQKRVYGITEIVNSENVRGVSIEKRRCRFPEENPLKNYKYYSRSACVVDCRAKKQLTLCNCTSHLMPELDSAQLCDLNGLICLMDNYKGFSSLVNPWSDKEGLKCDCLPSCIEPEYELVESFEEAENMGHAKIVLAIQSLPTLRLKRSVVRDQLDLVVSMGGSAGLFLGASLLSFFELIYFFTIRCSWNKYKRHLENKDRRKVDIPTLTQNGNIGLGLQPYLP